MVVRGEIKDGRIVLEGDPVLPEGAKVTVTIDEVEGEDGNDKTSPTAYERMKPIFGIAKNLPPDGARNVDHFLYGHPKK